MERIYTSNYNYYGDNRVDTTVKGKDPKWGVFSPTWSMVMGTKNGTMSFDEYTEKYIVKLGNVPDEKWNELFQMEEIVLVCFCPKDNFCHRNILTRYILDRLSGAVVYLGWK